jgi:hypothetical protein
MATYTEATRASEVILSEAPGTLSRETITIASGAGAIAVGMVLGKVTASGKYIPYDDGNVDASGNGDGSQNAAAIALEAVDATSADKTCAVLIRLGEYKTDMLAWASAVDATAKTAAYASLAGVYLIGR